MTTTEHEQNMETRISEIERTLSSLESSLQSLKDTVASLRTRMTLIMTAGVTLAIGMVPWAMSIESDLSAINVHVSSLAAREIPPPEVVLALSTLTARVDKLEDRVREHEARE